MLSQIFPRAFSSASQCVSLEFGGTPPNKGVELTVKSVTPFAGAKRAPLLPAAHAWRSATRFGCANSEDISHA